MYIALGSNISDPEALHEALELLIKLKCASFLYETPSVYLNDQPSFLLHTLTDLSPSEL